MYSTLSAVHVYHRGIRTILNVIIYHRDGNGVRVGGGYTVCSERKMFIHCFALFAGTVNRLVPVAGGLPGDGGCTLCSWTEYVVAFTLLRPLLSELSWRQCRQEPLNHFHLTLSSLLFG